MDDQALELRIKKAVEEGILLDKRDLMPVGPGRWPKVRFEDRLGACIHQNASRNFTDPIATARYHCGPNHIVAAGMPGIVYHIAIPKNDLPWLCSDLLNRTYGQAAPDPAYPGDENTHLLSILVMGGFSGPGYRGYASAPSGAQMINTDRVLKWAGSVFSFSEIGLFGHYHFGKAACPGYFLMNEIELRRASASLDLKTDRDWQLALLRWNDACLPKYGPDGDWGGESKLALTDFQRAHHLRVTGVQDPFTELILLRKYPP